MSKFRLTFHGHVLKTICLESLVSKQRFTRNFCFSATTTEKWVILGLKLRLLIRVLLPSETDTIVPKCHWHDCSQMRFKQLFSSDTGTIVSKWDWYDCSQVRLAQLFSSEAGTIVPKWDRHNYSQVRWHGCSQVNLAQLIPSDTGAIISKWD